MRRPKLALSAAFAALALSALETWAQQPPDDSSIPASGAKATRTAGRKTTTTGAVVPLDPMGSSRGARHLLRNGKDYLGYREYDRALDYFREAEKRQFELSALEKKDLQDSIQRAKLGLRGMDDEPAVSTARVARGRTSNNVAQRPNRRPGAIALADEGIPKLDPIQLTSADAPLPNPAGDQKTPAPDRTAERAAAVAPPANAAMVPGPAELPPLPPEMPAPSAAPEPLRERVAQAAAPTEPLAKRNEILTSAPPASVAPLTPAPLNEPAPSLDTRPSIDEPSVVTTTTRPASTVRDIPPRQVRTETASPAITSAQPVLENAPVQSTVKLAAKPSAPSGSNTVVDPAPAPPAELVLEPDTKPEAQPANTPTSVDPQSAALTAAPAESLPPLEPEPSKSATAASNARDGALAPELVPAQEPAPTVDDTAPAPESVPPLKTEESIPPLPASTTAKKEAVAAPEEIPVIVDESPSGRVGSGAKSESPAPAVVTPDASPQPAPAAAAEPKAPDMDMNNLPPLPAAPAPATAGTPERTRKPVSTVAPARVPQQMADRAVPLPAHIQREVEEIAQRQEEDARREAAMKSEDETPGGPPVGDADISGGRLELPRAPSPTEARPIRAIPIPEEFVPMVPRNWTPSRKSWAAAATCHMPLYFQDAVLERYGQSTEQALGPIGRFFSYPLDDPRQSTQRNQILQPFYSIGLFGLQIGLLPYNMIVDPPWEAEYDLGYYRPGDRIPTDSTYLPLHGVGPPLHGRRY